MRPPVSVRLVVLAVTCLVTPLAANLGAGADLAQQRQPASGVHPKDTEWGKQQLAGLDAMQKENYDAAEKAFLRALEAAKAPEVPAGSAAATENALGLVYRVKGQRTEAEAMYKRAIRGLERAGGPLSTDLSGVLSNLAILYMEQRRYQEAEPHLRRALSILEGAAPTGDYVLALPTFLLGDLARLTQRYDEADRLLTRALQIRERTRGRENLEVATTLHRLALLRGAQGRQAEAFPLFERALVMQEKTRGVRDSVLRVTLEDYATALRAAGREREAQDVQAKLDKLRAENGPK
jgi:tetratricopeptide (TPR) repeat protein